MATLKNGEKFDAVIVSGNKKEIKVNEYTCVKNLGDSVLIINGKGKLQFFHVLFIETNLMRERIWFLRYSK